MPLDLTDDKPTLVQVMAWCRQATRHYLRQCYPDLCRQMVLLGLNELIRQYIICQFFMYIQPNITFFVMLEQVFTKISPLYVFTFLMSQSMIACDLYDDLCDSLYTNIISVYPQFQDLTVNEKFIYIMKNCQIPAAKYAKAALDRHRKILYQWLWVAACPFLCIILFVVTYKP